MHAETAQPGTDPLRLDDRTQRATSSSSNHAAASGATVAAPVFFFQKVTYSFRTSGVYPNALGLWRNVEGGANEELVAPFDTSARFRFYQAGDDTSRVSPPAVDRHSRPRAGARGVDPVKVVESGVDADAEGRHLGVFQERAGVLIVENSMTHLSNRKGFAMPMAIFVIAVLTAALAAGFSGTATEITTNNAVRGQNRAYQLAEAGLEAFMVRRGESGWCTNCANPVTADSEWTRVSLIGGYADVVAVKVRPVIGASSALYFIRSKGTDTSTRLNGASGSRYATRTVGIYATWNTAMVNVKAAWLSLSGLSKNGTGLISGIDECGEQPTCRWSHGGQRRPGRGGRELPSARQSAGRYVEHV